MGCFGRVTFVGFDVLLDEAVDDDDQLFAEGATVFPLPFAVVEFEDGFFDVVGKGIDGEIGFGVGTITISCEFQSILL